MQVIDPNAYLNGYDNGRSGARGVKGGMILTFFTAVLVLLFATNVHGHFYQNGSNIKPLFVQLAVIGVAFVALLSRPDFIIHNYPKSLLAWIGLFTCLILLSFVLSSQSDAAFGQLVMGIKTSALFFSFVVLFMLQSNSNLIPKLLVAAVFLAVALNIYDFVVPTFSSSLGRAAGFYENANIAGRVISISMVLSCAAIPRRWRFVYCLVVGVGIIVTFSRSSWLLWVVGFTGLAATGQIFVRSRIGPAIAIGLMGVLIIYLLLSGGMLEIFRALGLDQFLNSGTFGRLGGTGDAFGDSSAIGRTEAIWLSLSEFSKNPWLGAGIGATTEWLTMNRPHNLYLMYAVEAGILGLLVLAMLFAVLWTRANPIGRVVVIQYAVSSMFTHNNLEHVLTLCLIAIMVAYYPKKEWTWGSWRVSEENRPLAKYRTDLRTKALT